MPKFQKAVENIVVNCLQIKGSDRVVVVTDQERLEIGTAIADRSRQVAETKLVIIEEHISRPAKDLPDSLKKVIDEFKPTVSAYAATGKPGELPGFRMPLINHLVKTHKARHGHMVGIEDKLMLSGMSLDYGKVQKAIAKLYKILKPSRVIKITCPYGTDLTVKLSPKIRWVPTDGRITTSGEWSNLPEGEIFTCPEQVNGKVVAWVVGDHFSEKFGVLKEPLVITIENAVITKVESENEELREEFWEYVSHYENGKRVGEFAVGALLGLNELTGNLLQDEKFPGVHMAFGHPYTEKTGAKWDAESHVDVIPLQVSIVVDGREIMRDGKFTIDLGANV
ncbi:hypothetical protein A2721_02350 [Candidatus Gottesmanbacteria bacterium RIFCSPHIGHO2_01_FULL_47_48]|uniref:Aminopeptidase n=1 Tax=Candidatus Gottesmanbacteria bacterium RIFCSPHIGHO2_01_FULL_47_48 TaxID=1798381 RepID=A0A1F6A3X5_9BACT|nr:MAG: hypothetical protein A2721_02350 [Candidatus Gottesmanbacteria bacterium RIFCSPHIGHO2_01_FULL_47_48]